MISNTRATMATRAARRLLRCYPHPWRARYEDEVLDLLDDASVRWRDVVDLSRGLLTERALALFEPGERPLKTSFALSALQLALIGVLALVAAGAGTGLRQLTGPLSFSFLALGTVVVFLGGMAFWTVSTGRHLIRLFRDPASVAAPPCPRPFPIANHWWLPALLLVIVVEFWSSQPLMWWPQLWLISLAIRAQLPGPLARVSLRLQAATTQLHRAKAEMKWARLELERCEQLQAQGQRAPLDEARGTVRRLEEQQAEALASLHAMGYRARFRSDVATH
jgi:hypothetical protein